MNEDVYEIHDQAEEAFADGDFDAARDAFEYVRAALGDAGRMRMGTITLAHVLNNLLACAQPRGDWAEMKLLATELIAVAPNDADPWIRLAIGQKQLGELADATASVLRAIELDPDDANARWEHACQLAVAGDREAAVERVAEAIERGARRADMMGDSELASLHDVPRFRELMKKR